VMMKITSSTSITSTSGVTLMSDSGRWPPAPVARPPLEPLLPLAHVVGLNVAGLDRGVLRAELSRGAHPRVADNHQDLREHDVEEPELALERAAAAQGTSEAEVVRVALMAATAESSAPTLRVPLFDSGDATLAERVDDELAAGFGE